MHKLLLFATIVVSYNNLSSSFDTLHYKKHRHHKGSIHEQSCCEPGYSSEDLGLKDYDQLPEVKQYKAKQAAIDSDTMFPVRSNYKSSIETGQTAEELNYYIEHGLQLSINDTPITIKNKIEAIRNQLWITRILYGLLISVIVALIIIQYRRSNKPKRELL